MCNMKNITLSIDEKELEAAREYAEKRGISLNNLIRQLLSRTTNRLSKDWMDRCFAEMDKIPKSAKKVPRWKREDLYDV